MAHQYLLILACSQRKRPNADRLPALERYDGVHFRVLRKARCEGHWPQNLSVVILSAKYGLISADEAIACYDQRMTPERARELRERIGASLDILLRGQPWHSIFVNVGGVYLSALSTSKELPRLGERVTYATGGIGERAAQLKRWLQTIQDDAATKHSRPVLNAKG